MSTKNPKTVVEDLLSLAGISCNGGKPFDINVHDDRFYPRVLHNASLGLGESYMDGWWDCDALDQFIERVLRAQLEQAIKGDWKRAWYFLKSRIFNFQSVNRSFQVGKQHYDIGNELYEKMLGRTMAYTSGYWKEGSTLDEAQEAKFDLTCRKLNLQPGMTLLDLGCGFGSFSRFAAERYGARVKGVTVSREQVAWGKTLCKGLPVELSLEDYRSVQGKYDRVISIGMIEHVGYKNYRTYMKVVERTLKANGITFIHTIGRNEGVTATDPWFDKYIFPNGMIPSIAQLGNAMEGIFVMEDWHNFGPDYYKTLMAWHNNFEKAWPSLKATYDERFHRMWRFYLLSCAGAFRARHLQVWQVVMSKPGSRQPLYVVERFWTNLARN